MKYNIKKLQSGGGFATFTPYLGSSGAPSTPPATQDTQPDKEETSSILDKDLYKELLTKGGLVNDVNQFVSQIEKIESSKNPYLNTNNQVNVLRMIAQINELKQNKAYWEDAYKTSEASGGLNEIAVGGSGEIYTRGKDNKIQAVTIQEYKKNKGKYAPMSVADLLNARQYDPSLTFNTSVFNLNFEK